jgi:hypothetical protein
VELSRMPLQTSEEHKWLESLQMYLARECDGRPYLHLGRDENAGVKMDLNEVRELRDALTDILRTASLSM